MSLFSRRGNKGVDERRAIIPPMNKDGWPMWVVTPEEYTPDPLTVLYEDGAWCIEGDLEKLLSPSLGLVS